MKKLRLIGSVRRLLFLNRLRTILSVSGIAIGIACEMITVGIGEGARNTMMAQIKSMGSDLVTVAAGTFTNSYGREMQTTRVTTLKPGDAKDIGQMCAYVDGVAPAQNRAVVVSYRGQAMNTTLIGTTTSFLSIRNYRVQSGRFFNAEEDALSTRVAVIGRKVVKSLFGHSGPLGKTIMVGDIPFKVIGILRRKGESYEGTDQDNVVLIPVNTALRRVFNISYISVIYVKASSRRRLHDVEEEIRNLLRVRHRLDRFGRKDDFTIQNVYAALKIADEADDSLTNLIEAFAALALIVGGAGILAVMFLSVKERSGEIGLRMAVGARPSDVLLQFFLEATALSTVGGLAGIALGVAGIYLLESFASVAAAVSPASVAVAVSESVMIGVLFGSLPARRASLVEPVKALRG